MRVGVCPRLRGAFLTAFTVWTQRPLSYFQSQRVLLHVCTIGPPQREFLPNAFSLPPCKLGYGFLPWNLEVENLVGAPTGIEPVSPAVRADMLTTAPQRPRCCVLKFALSQSTMEVRSGFGTWLCDYSHEYWSQLSPHWGGKDTRGWEVVRESGFKHTGTHRYPL